MIRVTHITPRFSPQRDGVGDYAALLAAELERSHGMANRFIVGDPSWSPLSLAPDARVAAVMTRTKACLEQQIRDADTLVLHYVGYGYHARGVPFWINSALRRWKQAFSNRRLVVIFHELWASGPPWKSEFYLGPLQRWLVTDLHRLCDGALTSVVWQKKRLDAIASEKTVLQPVPGNVPASSLDARVCHRLGAVRVVVFGLGPSRLQAVQTHERLLRALHRENLLLGIDVIGEGAVAGDAPSPEVRRLRTFLPAELVEAAADVTPQQAASWLRKAHLFLSFYPARFACKSGAFMAALGAGCVPVLADGDDPEPLAEGRHFLACDGSNTAVSRIIELVRTSGLSSLAEAGWHWQAQHASWGETAKKVAAALGSATATCSSSADARG